MSRIANNLRNASGSSRNAFEDLKLMIGAGEAKGLSSLATGADHAATGVGKMLFRPGREGGLLHGSVEGLGAGMQALRKSPGAMKAMAFGVPAALLADQLAQDRMTPLINEAVTEGRNVYANDKSFLEKKASLEERILEKTAGIKTAFDLSGLLNALGRGVSQGSGNANFLQGAGNLLGGGSRTAMGLGAMLPGIGGAVEAVAKQGLGSIGGRNNQYMGVADTAGYQMNRKFNPLYDRVRGDEQFASNFFSSLGSESAKSMVSLLKDMAGKAVSGLANAPAHHAMIGNLQDMDPMLRRADPQTLMDAYHSMSNFAPTLATDANAVRSFLREAVMAGAGPDYASIANLAKAESTINDVRKPRY